MDLDGTLASETLDVESHPGPSTHPDTTATLEVASVKPASVPLAPYKYKYKEAAPKPEGVDEKEWDLIYTAADSRIYNRLAKKAPRSAAARATGETHILALRILEERRAKAARTLQAQTSGPTAVVGPSTSTVLVDPENTATQTSHPLLIESTVSATMDGENVATTKSKTPTTDPTLPATGDQGYTKVPTRKGNKTLKVESSSSRSATPDGNSDKIKAATTSTIADKVKGKSRSSKKKPLAHDLSAKPQAPSELFGHQDPKQPQPFVFSELPVPDSDPKHQSPVESSLPTARQEFSDLKNNFKDLTMVRKESHEGELPFEVNARDTNDFDPDEKMESGAGKRFAGFEPKARGSANSPATSRSHSPTPKEASKPTKKKTTRGQKKKAGAPKKKAAAKEEKGKDDKGKGKSTEPEQDDDASDGASSDDGGEYCICRGPDDHRPMIACDNCDEWYHCSCVGVKESDVLLIDKYICGKCDIPGTHFTTWKPMCRLTGCRKPCDLNADPPSKYCSAEHKSKFWDQAIQRAPDGPLPSRGGAITKGELKSLLGHTKGDVKAFHALGAKPSLPTALEAIDWDKILTEEEKSRLFQITADKVVLNTRSTGFKDKEKVVRMAMDRLQKATEARKDLAGVCGWDTRLAMNEEEFQVWRSSEAGVKVFESASLDGSFCEKKRCPRHGAWVKLTLTECRMEDNLVHKQLAKLRAEEQAIKGRANTRAAALL